MYAVHDVPHILKNIRNTLKKQDIEYTKGKVGIRVIVKPFFFNSLNLSIFVLAVGTVPHVFSHK